MTEFLSYLDIEQKREPKQSNNTTSSEPTISFGEVYSGSVGTSANESLLRRALIIKNPGICRGRPTILGTRISVSNIIELGHVLDLDIEKIKSEYPFLNKQQIIAALEYYYENKNEIDSFLRQEKEIDDV